MISKGHPKLSIKKQCDLVSVHRSGYYYQPKKEPELNLKLMRLMDDHYLKHPYKGAKRMHTWLTDDMGYPISLNRVERLYYRVMGLTSTMPGKHTSKRGKGHKIYPYLLRNYTAKAPNDVWATDITYIPMAKGFMYLVAIIDLYSRKIMNWSISNTMDANWCKEALEEAINKNGTPRIINTDQGSQFTSDEFTEYVLAQEGLSLSMDGKGRATDNAFIERFWRSIKYEKIYLNPPEDGLDLYAKVAEYITYYNTERRHSSIGNMIPSQMYEQKKEPILQMA